MRKNHQYSAEIQIANATKFLISYEKHLLSLMTEQYQMVKSKISEVNTTLLRLTQFL